MQFRNMFSPIQIGPMEVKNRFVMAPMGNNFANTDGSMSEQSLSYYSSRAKGGFGYITFEATVIYKEAKGGPRKPCLFDDSTIASFKTVIDACHSYGARVGIQLQHAGPEGNSELTGYPLKAASSIPASSSREIPRSVSTEELYRIIEAYGDGAYRAWQAGADAVEIHCAHGYLVHTFISPRTNKRIDEFGGCFENRMHLIKEIIENVRKKCGTNLAILCRINASDEMDGGLTIQDSAAIAAYLEEECNINGLHVSRSVHLRDELMWAPGAEHGGFSSELVSEIKRAVTIPVITVGRYTEPQYAELMVREEMCDLVAFGRQAIADPELPLKAENGKLRSLNTCIGCLQGCVPNMFAGKPIQCLVNPLVGCEETLTKAKEAKKIIIAGGGVGGLYAAWACAKRGHSVDLYEGSDILGGNMRLAAYPPGKGDITNMIQSYLFNCQESGVRIHTGIMVTPELVKEKSPDAVIVATGSTPLILPIPGIEDAGILHAADVLSGNVKAGEKVLVAGGGLVGCETADFLAELGHAVTIIEWKEVIGMDMVPEQRKHLIADLTQYHTEVITGAKVTHFWNDGVTYEDKYGEERRLTGFDHVILAMGYRKNDVLSQKLAGIVPQVLTIGDASEARRAIDATAEALKAALLI